MDDERSLPAPVAETLGLLVADESLEQTLERVAALGRATAAGCAGVPGRGRRGRRRRSRGTDAGLRDAERTQHATGAGPGAVTVRTGETTHGHGAAPDERSAAVRQFATLAGVAIANARVYAAVRDLTRRLRVAGDEADTVEQAKGIVLAEQRCTPDEAYDWPARAAAARGRSVPDLAATVVSARTSTGT